MKIESKLLLRRFRYLAILSLAEGLLAIIWILSIPTDPKNALTIGLSLRRLLITILMGISIGSIMILLIASFLNTRAADLICGLIKKRKLMLLSCFLGAVLLLINLVTLSEWGKWAEMFERLRPLTTWISLVSLQWFFLCLIGTRDFVLEVKSWFSRRIIPSRYTIVITVVFLVVVYILSVLIYPQAIKEDFWYETGVPILGWQIILSILIGFVYEHFHEKIALKLGRRTDLITFITIALLCGLLWGFTPLAHGFFNPGPYPPNNIQYPYSDAAKFDLQAQSTLLGLGFDAGSPLDRPIYPLFLAIIHLISGQIFTNNMMLQAGLFGIFPAIIYLICTELGSRTWGVFSSAAISLWGWNAVLSNSFLNTSNPKQILTDFPMAIMISLVIFVALRWMKSGEKSKLYAFVLGGLLAAAVFVRYNGIVLIPILIIIAIIINRPFTKKGLIEASFIIIGFLVFTTPWYTRNILAGQEFKIPFTNKILFVLQHRYQTKEINSTKWIATKESDGINIEPTLTVTDNSQENTVPDKIISNGTLSLPFSTWFPAHLIHNVMSSILILPTSVEISSLRTSLDLGGQIWKPTWNGILPATRVIILIIQLFILSAGIIILIKRDKVAGAFVVLTFVGIQTANALGRTSGGRYIVPVDWLVIILYFAGYMFLFGKQDSKEKLPIEKEKTTPVSWRKMVITFLFILLFGAIPVIYERVSLSLFHQETKIPTMETLKSLPGIIITDPDLLDISRFLDQNQTKLSTGYVYYPVKRDIPDMNLPSAMQNINEGSLLSFSFIQDGKYWTGYFPFEKKVDIQNQDKVILIGCEHNEWVLIRDLVIIRPGQTSYLKSDYRIDNCDLIVRRK